MSHVNDPKPTNPSTREGKMTKKQPYIKFVYVDPNVKPERKKDKDLSKENLLRWRDVKPRVGICRSYVHALVREGKFPEPVKVIGRRASAWVESEINAWVNEQIANRKKTR